MEQITFRFTGAMADESQMNFYEFGRFQYGAARFIFTIEKFRQTGKVLQKVSSYVDADIRVSAPKKGSFIQDILFVATPVIADCAIQCSFEAIFAYVWDAILPSSKGKDVALALSQEETKRAQLLLGQEAEKTKQIALMTEVANNNNATTQQALEIIKALIEQGILTSLLAVCYFLMSKLKPYICFDTAQREKIDGAIAWFFKGLLSLIVFGILAKFVVAIAKPALKLFLS